jgi:hypothetical protein
MLYTKIFEPFFTTKGRDQLVSISKAGFKERIVKYIPDTFEGAGDSAGQQEKSGDI